MTNEVKYLAFASLYHSQDARLAHVKNTNGLSRYGCLGIMTQHQYVEWLISNDYLLFYGEGLYDDNRGNTYSQDELDCITSWEEDGIYDNSWLARDFDNWGLEKESVLLNAVSVALNDGLFTREELREVDCLVDEYLVFYGLI